VEGQKSGKHYAPENKTEEKLVEIWKEIMDMERIGTRDNFFEIGGNSLMALRIISRVNLEFGVEIEIVELIQMPRIFELSLFIDRKRFSIDKNKTSESN
ncbi:MAG: hypothetical protein H6605_07200, partial [Flavobacteriales bacterium]|nr:hypothetical protein [Flavobacteriales bacterium]